MLTLARQGVGQLHNAVQAKPRRTERAGKALTQAADSLLESSLRAQRRTAQEPRFHHEPEPVPGNERLGRLEPLQRQSRRAAIKVKHRVEQQSIYEAERVSDA